MLFDTQDNMFVHVYSNGKIMENETISFDEAMYMIQNQQSVQEEPENYIGFTSEKDQNAVIQFVRENSDEWIIDIPVLKDNEFRGSYLSKAHFHQIIGVLTSFYVSDSELTQLILDQNYKLLIEFCQDKWSLSFHFIDSQDLDS